MGLSLVCLDDARRCGSLNARASSDRLCLLGVLHIMGWEGILTVVTFLSVLSTLMFTRYQADLVLVAPAGILSAFMNNTAVVAMFIPAVQLDFWLRGR